MKPEEAIQVIKTSIFAYGIARKQKETEAVALAIEALEKQIAKKPILIQHPQPYKRDFKCPVCSGDVNRQWEYEHYDDSMIGEEQYEYCPDCGTKIDWEAEDEKKD